jgi:hypothetical protein
MIGIVSCGDPTFEYYGRATIDPATLHVTLHDTIGIDREGAGRFYFRFNDARGRPGITYGEADSAGNTTACFDHFSLDTAYTFVSRVKSQELWRGEFGLVLGQTTYYYAAQYADQGTGFVTLPNPTLVCVEHPTVIRAPADSAVLRLDAVSVVRVFATDSGFAIVAGNYSPLGMLQSLTRGHVRPQLADSPDDLRATDVSISFVAQPPDSVPAYGFVTTFDPRTPSVLRATRAPGTQPPLRELVSWHYNRNVVVRQESDSSGVPLAPRWLRFEPTYADSVLVGIDSTRTFGLTTWLKRN